MPPKWSSKFRLKGKSNTWVFVPSPESALTGKLIKEDLETHWTAPPYYFHLQKGGHVAALKSHLGKSFFLHLDIKNFFGNISKARVTRSLTKIVGYKKARTYAESSTVYDPRTRSRKTMLPFGFIQSQLLASLCLKNSALGTCLDRIAKSPDFAVSVYVDDIVVSSTNLDKLRECFEQIQHSATVSLFTFNEEKTEEPADSISAFNIRLESKMLSIDNEKCQLFCQRLSKSDSHAERMGVLGYVATVNIDQAIQMAEASRRSK